MTIIDYFIKDKDVLPQEEYDRSRLLVIVLIALITISLGMTILGLFGMFKGFTIFFIFIVLVVNLFLLKSRGNLDVVFFVTTLICTALMVYNTVRSGYILSLDNKWLIIALITIFFMKPKWLTPYALFLFVLQTFYLVMMLRNNQNDVLVGGIFEEYVDNLLFFGLCYGLLRLLNKYQNKQNEMILEANKLLSEKTGQLLESNEELEKFAFVVSHDIKSPLRNVISFASLLERSIQHSKYSNAEEYTIFIKNSCLKLDKLVGGILNHSRLGASDVTSEKVELVDLIHEIELSISDYIAERNAKIIIASPLPVLFIQKSMMVQLFKNLIENGLKYNESDIPTVTIKNILISDENYIIISDNGIGINEEYHSSIFNMFTRLHNEQYEGTGIGLSTCKKILNKIGGNINISSKEGQGTSFEIHIPASYVLRDTIG